MNHELESPCLKVGEYVNFVETWNSDEELDLHLSSVHIQNAFERVEGLLAAFPDIRRYRLLA